MSNRSAGQGFVHGPCHLFPRCHRVDEQLRTVCEVAGDEDIGGAGAAVSGLQARNPRSVSSRPSRGPSMKRRSTACPTARSTLSKCGENQGIDGRDSEAVA